MKRTGESIRVRPDDLERARRTFPGVKLPTIFRWLLRGWGELDVQKRAKVQSKE